MKNIDAEAKYFEHKRKRHERSSEVLVISSESENDSEESDQVSLSSDSSPERIVVASRKRKHRCRHKELDRRERPNDASEFDSHRVRNHHYDRKRHHKSRTKEEEHRRRREETTRIKEESSDSNTKHGKHSCPRRKHRRESASSERVRCHRRREVDKGEPSHSTNVEHNRYQRESARGTESDERQQWNNNAVNASQKVNIPVKKERVSEDESKFEWGKKTGDQKDSKSGPQENKAKPNFEPSGKLIEETNMFNGVLIKYSEPPEARKPKRRWRLYPFKGDQGLPTLYIHRQSCYLIGRERKIADIPVDHPSCSKQHAALQYRLVPYEREDGSTGRRVRPYIIDLESSNGTFVNNVKIETKKYVELIEKDVIKFGYSSREYVLLHEHSKDDEADDDIAA